MKKINLKKHWEEHDISPAMTGEVSKPMTTEEEIIEILQNFLTGEELIDKITDKLLKLFSLQKQEIVRENKRLHKIANRYAKTISLLSDGMPYEELPKRLK